MSVPHFYKTACKVLIYLAFYGGILFRKTQPPQANWVEVTLQGCLSVVMLNAEWIDPLLLKTFVAVADTGSFVGAANRVGRTQSAVSMQMKRLEDIAGPPNLFIRIGRNMTLTDRARSMVAYARRVLEAHEDMAEALNRRRTTQEIRLGSPEDYVEALLPKALDRFSSLCPEVEVNVFCDTSEALHRRVAEHQIDLAIVTAGQTTPVTAAVRQEPLVWVAARDCQPETEAVIPLAVFQPGCTSRAIAIDACVAARIGHRIAFSSPSLAALLSVVRQGLAIATLARCSVPKDLRILSEKERMPALPSLTISMLRPGGVRHGSVVNMLANELRTALTST